jgi:general secretion pathway protein D
MKKNPFIRRLFLPLLIALLALSIVRVPAQSAEELITMNFEEADIRILIKFISELTQKNFIIDEKVKGKVTIVSPEKVSVAEAYSVFESILEVKGFTLVPTGKVIKIVPSGEAKQRGIETVTGKATIPMDRKDEFVTRITRLDYVNVDDLAALIRPLISKEGHLVTYKQTNTMIVTDLKSNLYRILKIINELDVKGYHAELYVIPLWYASVNTVAQHLNSILEQTVSAAGTQSRPAARRAQRGQTPAQRAATVSGVSSSAKIIPDERTNSLIVLATRSEYENIISLVQKLDVEAPEGSGRINIYYLQNAVAEEIVAVINEFITGIKAEQPGAAAGAAPRLPTETDIKIVADRATNSLIINADPEDYEQIKLVVQKLDIPRSQVLIEALFIGSPSAVRWGSTTPSTGWDSAVRSPAAGICPGSLTASMKGKSPPTSAPASTSASSATSSRSTGLNSRPFPP